MAWFAGTCVRVQFLPLASGREINYMLEFYVFLYKSHLQIVLLFSKEPHNWTSSSSSVEIFYFPQNHVRDSKLQDKEAKFVFSKGKKELVKTALTAVLCGLVN